MSLGTIHKNLKILGYDEYRIFEVEPKDYLPSSLLATSWAMSSLTIMSLASPLSPFGRGGPVELDSIILMVLLFYFVIDTLVYRGF